MRRSSNEARMLYCYARNGRSFADYMYKRAANGGRTVEGLEEVLLNDSKPERITRIGTLASLPVKQALTTFLRENQDVFA